MFRIGRVFMNALYIAILLRQIIFLGDSNMRHHYYRWCKRVQGIEVTGHTHKNMKAWHKPLHCLHAGLNLNMSWLPHANPFRSSRVSISEYEYNNYYETYFM